MAPLIVSPAIGIGGSLSKPAKKVWVSPLSQKPGVIFALVAFVPSAAVAFYGNCSVRLPSIMTVVELNSVVTVWSAAMPSSSR